MAQHDLGGSCTAHRYCHSEARISGQVKDEHGGLSAKRAVMIPLTFCMRKRHSSYSHRVLSTLSGDCAILSAMSWSTGMMLFDPIGCVRKLCSALRCSVSWKAESIYPSVSYAPSTVQPSCAHLRQIYQRWSLCHILRLGSGPYPSLGGMLEVAEQLLLFLRRG